MSNFETSQKDYQEYAKLASSAESLIYSDPRSSLTVFGTFGEQLTKEIMHLDDLGDWELNQKQRIEKMAYSKNEYPPTVLNALNLIRLRRNKATHDDHFIATKKIALEIDQSAYLVWKWFLEVYSLDKVADYVEPQDQKALIKTQEDKIKALEEKIKQLQQNRVQEVIISPEERERRRQINVQFAKKHELTEAETRQLIDQQLRDAGWEVDSQKLNNWTQKTEPQKGHNMAIAEWVLPNGQRADYALFKGLEFYGIVEAKKWDQDIAGQMAQPKEYSKEVPFRSDYRLVSNEMGDYKVPFIYTANGRPYLKQYQEKSGIWFWDARNPKESAYALEEFHKPEDLSLKLSAKNKEEANQDLVDDQDFPDFAHREYQITAIQAMENAIKDGKKRILLAMATGTGKTRTAIALMYRLLKHKRARRILYLVDRNSLGKQTSNAIKDNKIGMMSISSIYGLKELSDKAPEISTKIQIATVQGMIKRLFFSEDSDDKPSVGQYDFIIVDEAHRGYAEDKELSDKEYQFYSQEDYVSQYRRVVDYFDATAIGMTATPALQTMEGIVTRPTQAVTDKLNYYPFLFDEKSKIEDTYFEVKLELKNKIYDYSFSYNRESITSEALTLISGNKEKSIFSRNGNDIHVSNKLLEDSIPKLRNNSLFLYLAQSENDADCIAIYKWFADDLLFIHDNLAMFSQEKFLSQLENKGLRKEIVSFLNFADLNIYNIRLKDKPYHLLKRIYIVHKIYDHDKMIGLKEIKLANESTGLQQILQIVLSIVFAQNEGNDITIVMDDFSKAFHIELASALVKIFNSKESLNQFIVTTHNVQLMDNDLRIDQIYLIDKDFHGISNLKSVFDFEDARNIGRHDISFAKRYLQGKFGAMPVINIDGLCSILSK